MSQKKNTKQLPRRRPTRAKKIVILLLVAALFGAAFYISRVMISRSSERSTSEKSIELPGLKLYSVQDFDYTDDYSYYLTYPQNDIAAFDDAVDNIVQETRSDFLAQVTTNKAGDLTVSYDVNFYNDQFLSVDLFIYRTVEGTAERHVQTILFDRDAEQLVHIDDLFKENSDYLDTLSALSRSKLPAILGNDYRQTHVEQGTEASDSYFQNFTVDRNQNLVLVFEPGQVAPKEKGIVTVRISGGELSGVLKQPYVGNLFQVAAAPLPAQQNPTPTPSAPPSGPIPQADPSGVNCAVAKCVALTFDDGPSYTTPRLLDILKANNVKATFFELGIQAQKYPSITKRVVSEGHVIGNHTYDHKNLERMSVTDARGEIGRAADIIQAAGGVRPGLVRAPYGAINQPLAQTLGAAFINWNVDPDDWKDRNANTVYKRVMDNVKPGAIVLSHDIYETTVDAYERIIPELISQGYVLVTVPQLLGFGPNAAPGVYFSR